MNAKMARNLRMNGHFKFLSNSSLSSKLRISRYQVKKRKRKRKMQHSQTSEDIDWEFYDYASHLEKEWRSSERRLTDKELLSIFPEAKTIIRKKIKELKNDENEMTETIRQKLLHINAINNETLKILLHEWLVVNEGAELVKIGDNIASLREILLVAKGRIPKGWISDDQKQRAQSDPNRNIVAPVIPKERKNVDRIMPAPQGKNTIILHLSRYEYVSLFWLSTK